MKRSITTILFMMIITIIFISALASINELSRERVIQNARIDQYKSMLYAFNIFPEGVDEQKLAPTSTTNDIPWQQDQILRQVEQQIRPVKLPISADQQRLLNHSLLTVQDTVTIYTRLNQSGKVVAYGFPLRGKGLWGTITAFGVVSADLKKMVGIDFTEQVETPGLGARITETEFKYFFRNLDLSRFEDQAMAQPIVLVKKKDQTNIAESTNSFQAITGATQTVSGVLKMVNTDLRFYLEVIRQNEELIQRSTGLQ